MRTNTKPQVVKTETESPKLVPLILVAITNSHEWQEFQTIALPREEEKLIGLIRENIREDKNQLTFNMTRLKQDIAFKLSVTTVAKGRQRISYKPPACSLLFQLFNSDNFTYLKATKKVIGDQRKWKPPQFLIEAIAQAEQS